MIFAIMGDGKRQPMQAAHDSNGRIVENFVKVVDIPFGAVGIEVISDYAPELVQVSKELDPQEQVEVWLFPGFEYTKKIAIIKSVRESTGFGLKESKDVVDLAQRQETMIFRGALATAKEFRRKAMQDGAKVQIRIPEEEGPSSENDWGETCGPECTT